MPIQIIKRTPVEEKRSPYDRDREMMGLAFDFAKSAQSSYQAKAKEDRAKKELTNKEEAENKYLKLKTGQDFTGATPDERQKAYESFLKKEEKTNEFQEKIDRYKKYGFSDYLQGGEQSESEGQQFGSNGQNQNKPESFSDQINRPGQKSEDGNMDLGVISLKTDVPNKKMPEGMIFDAEAMGDHNLAQQIREHNKAIDVENQHKENLNFKKQKASKKEVSDSFKNNQDYINKTYDQYEDSLRKEAILGKMKGLEEKGEMSDSGVVNMLETVGLSPEWLKNPDNEEYTKLGLDLLGGGSLQADYGSKLFASEFQTSLKRIPTLSQTAEGRRQIRENLQTALLPARLKNERLQFYLDKAEKTGEPLPHDLRGKILRDIKPQLEESYDKFKQRNGRYPVKDGTIPDDNAIEKYYYISDGNFEKANKMMKEDGYYVQPESKHNGISGGSARSRSR
jgi:hypothetical protein